MKNYPNYAKSEERVHYNQERKRPNNSGRKIAAFALGAIMTFGTIAGCSELNKYDKAQKSKEFVSNGGAIPTLETLSDEETANINFTPLADNEFLVLEAGGSIRQAPFSGDIEHLSTILMSNNEVVLDKVREVGQYNARGDGYYVADLDDMPEAVQEYVEDNNIELSEVDNEDVVFINKKDVKTVEAETPQEQDTTANNLASNDVAAAAA